MKYNFFLSGIFCFVAAWLDKSYFFVPVGCLFILAGIIFNIKSKKDQSADENQENE